MLRQEMDGPVRKLRVAAKLETTETLLKADEIDYNELSGAAEARGNVYFERFETGEILHADRVEYNLKDGNGKF
ncbi:MAG: hypothetical protein FJW38_20310, partial [Acidobacteria bacterium]|nr:hypothetical protein [Acidobacteriota bacterium]